MDWREDTGRKSQYARVPDNETFGLKSSKVCRVCRVFAFITDFVYRKITSVSNVEAEAFFMSQNFLKNLKSFYQFLRLKVVVD